MTTYEYAVDSFEWEEGNEDLDRLNVLLNQYGSQGWKLISQSWRDEAGQCLVTFEKALED